MADKPKANYKIGKNKVIYADLGKCSGEEKEKIQMYINAGYILKAPIKSKTKGDKLNKDGMLAGLKDDKENLAILKKKFENKENFLRIKKWYYTVVNK